jgi:hypothetical protein
MAATVCKVMQLQLVALIRIHAGVCLARLAYDAALFSVFSCLLESLGFAQNFLSSCELEALHFIGIRSFGEEFREDVVFRGIQEKFRKPLA